MNLLFAWRYFRSKKSTHAINLIARISMVAIAVGSAALIIVLSVFNGFEDLVKSLYKDFYADIRIVPSSGKTFQFTRSQAQQVSGTGGVAVLSYLAEEKALLVNGDCQSIVYIKGVDQHYTEINRMQNHIKRGKFTTGTLQEPELVLGAGIENAVCANAGGPALPLTLYLPNRQGARLGSMDGLNVFNATVAGAFVVQQDFDNKYVFSNIPFLKYMLDMDVDEYSAIELKVNGDADLIKKSIQQQLGGKYLVQTRYEQNRTLYAVMQMEKWVIYGILSLILVVAAFNMVGALTMLVLEKQKDIAVLKAMGASEQRVQQIFMSEGLLLASVGGVMGILLAGLICWVQLKFHVLKLGGDTFIIDYYPVQLLPGDFMLVTATVLIIALLAAWIPSRKASRQFFSLKS